MLRAVLICLAVLAVPSASPVAAQPARQVSVVRYGVKLTMTVPRTVYPQNALALVHVTLQNVSHRTIWEAPSVVGFCSSRDILVDVLDNRGQEVSPLPPFPGPYPSCPAPLPYPLHPGQIRRHTVAVALLAAHLQATSNVNTLKGTRNYSGAELSTPVLTVHLRPSVAPAVTVDTAGSTATITKPRGATGPLRYQEWSDCGPRVAQPVLFWATVKGNRVGADCSRPRSWHLVAGWAGYRVAVLNYVSPVVPTTVLITPPFSSSPYGVHVGDIVEVKLLLLGPGVDVATVDPAHLHQLSATASGAEPVRYDWRWQAVAPGDTSIVIAKHAPANETHVIKLHIVQ